MTDQTDNLLSNFYIGEDRVSVEEQLGTGLTAIVYWGKYKDREVAVKVLRSNSQAIRDAYFAEKDHLKNIWNAWETRYPDRDPITPEFIGDDPDAASPFFLMELIQGKPIETIYPLGKPMEEAKTLAVMCEFGRLLVVLHEDLDLGYSDVKFNNLFLLEPLEAKLPRLKVIDWNILEKRTNQLVEHDLFFASLFLFRLMTGEALPVLGGYSKIQLEQADNFQSLSIGSKEFLTKALHTNSKLRYATAAAWLDEANCLLEWWNKSSEDLIKIEASKMINAARENKIELDNLLRTNARIEPGLSEQHTIQAIYKMDDAAKNYGRARRVLDIARKKGGGNQDIWQKYWGEVDEKLQATSNLQKGTLLLNGDSYKAAMREFDKGAIQCGEDAEILRRWYWLAHSANELGLEYFRLIKEKAISSVILLVEGKYLQANKEFDEVFNTISQVVAETSLVGIAALRNETQIYILTDQAERDRNNGKFREAISQYQEADHIKKGLPQDPPTAWGEKIGDIGKLIQAVNDESKSRGDADHYISLAKAYLETGEFKDAAEAYHAATIASPGEKVYCEEWKGAILGQMKSGDLNGATTLVNRARLTRAMLSDTDDLWNVLDRLNKLNALIK